mmetsp:Transcript_30005/g.74967  ORF Transcript_30005/g.74967 Transcript_30005/m.74967 type:complete len:245 (+) Transcript_30005:165-899(+)
MRSTTHWTRRTTISSHSFSRPAATSTVSPSLLATFTSRSSRRASRTKKTTCQRTLTSTRSHGSSTTSSPTTASIHSAWRSLICTWAAPRRRTGHCRPSCATTARPSCATAAWRCSPPSRGPSRSSSAPSSPRCSTRRPSSPRLAAAPLLSSTAGWSRAPSPSRSPWRSHSPPPSTSRRSAGGATWARGGCRATSASIRSACCAARTWRRGETCRRRRSTTAGWRWWRWPRMSSRRRSRRSPSSS